MFQEHGTQVAVVTEDDRVHFKPITVSKLLDNAVEVAEGISTSDRIVNNPSAALLEGDKCASSRRRLGMISSVQKRLSVQKESPK